METQLTIGVKQLDEAIDCLVDAGWSVQRRVDELLSVSLVGIAATHLRPELANAGPIPYVWFAKHTLAVWLASWLIVAIHTWMSSRWSGFPIPLAPALVGHSSHSSQLVPHSASTIPGYCHSTFSWKADSRRPFCSVSPVE